MMYTLHYLSFVYLLYFHVYFKALSLNSKSNLKVTSSLN